LIKRNPLNYSMSQPENNPKEGGRSKRHERRDEELLRRERIENMGLLATRVAHDLNNMLAPMKMAIPLLRPAVADAGARNLLDSFEATVGRATALVRQILEYAEGAGGQLQVVPIEQLLEEVAHFAAESFPRNIRVVKHIPAELWQVNMNLSQIHQVLLNLCVNARDAMAQGGMLTLRAENCVLDAVAAGKITGGRAGSYLVLQIVDTGTGFPPSVLARMWEPFITTKKSGKGSGLGLSTIRAIVTHHQGFIQLRTAAGEGSSFRIYLPATGMPAVKLPMPPVQVSQPLAHASV
jgi:signal transduction histidine kinase